MALRYESITLRVTSGVGVWGGQQRLAPKPGHPYWHFILSHAGQNLEYHLPLLLGPFPAYLFSKPLNWLDFDPTYPRNPATLGEYIRKFRKDKGISQVEMAKVIGVHEMTIVNWETTGMVPKI